MKINTLLSPLNVDDLYFTKKTTIVIDVLRATTTIVAALNNGAKEIQPVSSIEFAMQVSGGNFSGQTLLAGERNTKKIDGFALGNSPFEYISELVNGKTILFFTTNGSKAIVKAKYSSTLLIACFLNVNSIANYVSNLKEIVILCSGNNGLFSFEDSVCAGNLISEIKDHHDSLELDDASKTCLFLYNKHSNNLEKTLKETEHGKNLIKEGFIDDIKYASKRNTINAIPIYAAGSIKLMK